MSLFSFNEVQRHGEGSFLHQYNLDTNYNVDITITPIQGHQYHLDFVNDHQGNKLSIYEFMFGAQTFSVWEFQVFMNDNEITGFRGAVNYPMECKNPGILNDPMSFDTVSIGKCKKCGLNQFETEKCEDLPSINGHCFFHCYQQFIDRNQSFDAFDFNKYPLKVSNVFI